MCLVKVRGNEKLWDVVVAHLLKIRVMVVQGKARLYQRSPPKAHFVAELKDLDQHQDVWNAVSDPTPWP